MGSVGDAYDNALCESFFATLECELLDRRRFPTRAEARMAVFNFIEGWYNPHRRHSGLDYLSPIAMNNVTQSSRSAKAVHRPRNRGNSGIAHSRLRLAKLGFLAEREARHLCPFEMVIHLRSRWASSLVFSSSYRTGLILPLA
jgi:hypothetical protein